MCQQFVHPNWAWSLWPTCICPNRVNDLLPCISNQLIVDKHVVATFALMATTGITPVVSIVKCWWAHYLYCGFMNNILFIVDWLMCMCPLFRDFLFHLHALSLCFLYAFDQESKETYSFISREPNEFNILSIYCRASQTQSIIWSQDGWNWLDKMRTSYNATVLYIYGKSLLWSSIFVIYFYGCK